MINLLNKKSYLKTNFNSILAVVTGNENDEQTIRIAHQLINKSQNSNI